MFFLVGYNDTFSRKLRLYVGLWAGLPFFCGWTFCRGNRRRDHAELNPVSLENGLSRSRIIRREAVRLKGSTGNVYVFIYKCIVSIECRAKSLFFPALRRTALATSCQSFYTSKVTGPRWLKRVAPLRTRRLWIMVIRCWIAAETFHRRRRVNFIVELRRRAPSAIIFASVSVSVFLSFVVYMHFGKSQHRRR